MFVTCVWDKVAFERSKKVLFKLVSYHKNQGKDMFFQLSQQVIF